MDLRHSSGKTGLSDSFREQLMTLSILEMAVSEGLTVARHQGKTGNPAKITSIQSQCGSPQSCAC